MTTEIRKAEKGDLPEIIRLMSDFADFERLTEYMTASEQRLSVAMFGPEAFVEGLVGIFDGQIVAYALFYPAFSSFRGERGIYLEDIYIDPKCRRQALGDSIIRTIARLANGRGFARIDFQVLDWNTPAINFYKKLGAESNSDESHFVFRGKAFELLTKA